MAKIFNGMIPFASAIQPTGAQPLDDRVVVAKFSDLTDDSTFGLAKYNGMLVAVVEDQQVYMLVDADNSTSAEAWVTVGTDYSGDISGIGERISAVEAKVTPAANSGLEVVSNALKVKIDSATDNALKVTDNGLKVVAPVYDFKAVDTPDQQYASQYVFSKDGVDVTTINIPKDQFLKSASYDADGDKLVFVFNTFVDGVYTEKSVDVDVKDLVDIYSGSDYIEVSSNVISVKYDAIKTQLSTDLKAEFGIATINENVAANAEAIAAIEATINAENTGIAAVVASHTTAIGSLEGTVSGISAKVTTNTTDIGSIKDTIATMHVRSVNTDASYGIALTHTDALGNDGVNDTVGISVNIDTLAQAVIERHEITTPDASVIKVTAAGSFTTDTNVQAAIESLDSRIKAAVSGGVTSVVAGNGISVNSTDANNPTVSVNTSAIVAEGSALTVSDNKIDLVWSQL